MDKDKALKLALEALEGNTTNPVIDPDQAAIEDQAINAIKQALAAPVQEPVATLWQHGETGRTRITMPGDITDCDARWFKAADLYTTPPAQPAPAVQEPLFADIIARHPGLAEELKAMDTAPVQKPVALQMDVIVVNLVREGINKHRARELAEHFIKHISPPAAQRQWVGLTAAEQRSIEKKHIFVEDAIRLTEAKLKELNT